MDWHFDLDYEESEFNNIFVSNEKGWIHLKTNAKTVKRFLFWLYWENKILQSR